MTEFQKEVSELINSGFAVSEISKKLNRPMNSVSSVIKALIVYSIFTSFKNLLEKSDFSGLYKIYYLFRVLGKKQKVFRSKVYAALQIYRRKFRCT